MFYSFISKHIKTDNPNIAIYNSGLVSYSYQELYTKIEEIEAIYSKAGLKSGNLLILRVEKSFEAVAHLLCCIKMGIVYIPVALDSPETRVEKIISSSKANAILLPDFTLKKLGSEPSSLDQSALCVLYTSGSTGTPKGVVCSSTGIQAFIEWSISEFKISSKELFTSFAPFHFDLSTFDIFASIASGGSVWLINKKLTENFRLLGELTNEIKPTIWYATPTAFSLLNEYGKLNEDYCPRISLFAGEVFPIKKLNALRERWKTSVFYNLYGPTETNVCTYYKLPENIEENRQKPYPIGKPCPYTETKISEEGELLVTGKSVMLEYLNNKAATDEKLISINESKWVKTGDKVNLEDSVLVYSGRIDRMIKKNGYRIELGEIENTLIHHPDINSIAIISASTDWAIEIIAYYTGLELSTIKLKTYSSMHLMNYMIPDKFIFMENLPINSNGKVNYSQLINTFNKR